MTEWLGRGGVAGWFVSAIRLRTRPVRRAAAVPWALDSGGFTELSTHGKWSVPPARYAEEVCRWGDVAGPPAWAAIQDWMCEPFMLAKTGLSVAEHQRRTCGSYNDLRGASPGLPWVPVLQGWEPDDYRRHRDMYRSECGLDLAALPLVGLGSVCRRAAVAGVGDLIRELHAAGVRVHAFGFKVDGLRRHGAYLASADSLAWSFRGRRAGRPLCRAEAAHRTCGNCYDWAVEWTRRLKVGPPGGPNENTKDRP